MRWGGGSLGAEMRVYITTIPVPSGRRSCQRIVMGIAPLSQGFPLHVINAAFSGCCREACGIIGMEATLPSP